MRPPTFMHERELVAQGYTPIGIDEAGCGCLAGPVVAAALHLPFDACHRGLCPLCDPSARQRAKPYGRRAARLGDIRDSKLLSAAQRERLFDEFQRRGYRWAIGVATHEEIDRVNIRQATYLAMRRAVEALLSPSSSRAERSGVERSPSDPLEISPLGAASVEMTNEVNWYALVDAWTIPNLSIPQRGIIRGDRVVKSIAAASIVAKVARDAMMDELDRAFPHYGFSKHKGYATAEHRAEIQAHGLSPVHRVTFCSTRTPERI